MGTPPTATTRDGAFLALALADALKLGLPDPDYITMSPHNAGTRFSAVSFQFNACHGQDPLPALYAWADRFGVDVNVSTGVRHPSSTWHKFGFTLAGVVFDAYAEIAAPVTPCGSVAPYSLAECALPDGHDGRHESQHQPAIVWDPVAVLAASIDAGTPLITYDDEAANDPCARCDEPMGAHARAVEGGYLCPADVTASISMRIGGGAS